MCVEQPESISKDIQRRWEAEKVKQEVLKLRRDNSAAERSARRLATLFAGATTMVAVVGLFWTACSSIRSRRDEAEHRQGELLNTAIERLMATDKPASARLSAVRLLAEFTTDSSRRRRVRQQLLQQLVSDPDTS